MNKGEQIAVACGAAVAALYNPDQARVPAGGPGGGEFAGGGVGDVAKVAGRVRSDGTKREILRELVNNGPQSGARLIEPGRRGSGQFVKSGYYHMEVPLRDMERDGLVERAGEYSGPMPGVSTGYAGPGSASPKGVERGDLQRVTFRATELGKRVVDAMKPAPPTVEMMKSGPEIGKVASTGKYEYKVGIHKSYFPKEMRPTEIGSEHQEVVVVRGDTRTEAAQTAWAAHGDRWLQMMGPRQTTLPRIVRLHTNEPKAGVGGLLGRLEPVKVHEGE